MSETGQDRRRRYLLALGALALAGLVGGVVGGLIVRATWTSDNDTAANAKAVPANGPAASCNAAKVADGALQSVVTVQASNGHGGGGSGSGVVIRPGGYVLTNDHVIAVGPGDVAVSILRGDGESVHASIV